MNKNAFLSFCLVALMGILRAQTPMSIPNGSFEQWTSHDGYSVTAMYVIHIPVYEAYSTPSVWNYPLYPINQTVSVYGYNVNINTSVPIIKASQETTGVPDGNKAVKLQTFMLSDIINSTVLSVAGSSLDPSLTSQVIPSILSTGDINISSFIPLVSNMMSTSGDIYSMIPTLVAEDVNDYITGGIALGEFRPGTLTGSYKYHSATSGDNGAVLLLGTRYNSTTHRREIVGGGVNLDLVDVNTYTPFEVEYQPLSKLIPGSPNLEPDSLIILLFSSAGNNRQQGSYLCLDNLKLWPAPDTVWRTVTVTANVDGACEPYGSGLYVDGDTVEIGYIIAGTATDGGHWEYLGWNDGETANPRQIIVTSDTSFVVFCQWIADSVGVETVGSQQPLVTVSPNPAKEQCSVTLADGMPAVLTLYTADGRRLKTVTTDGGPVMLDLPFTGILLLQATTSIGTTTSKVVSK